MNHIAIDLGGNKSQICVRNPEGEILEEREIQTSSLPRYLQKQSKSRVVMETCSEFWAISDAALAAQHEVRVVAGSLVRSLGVGQRRIKTDRRDAQVLSEVSTRIDLPSVYLRSPQAREIQVMLRMRERLVRCRTELINSVRGWLRTQTLRVPAGATNTFPQRVRARGIEIPSYMSRQLDEIESLSQHIQKAAHELTEKAESIPMVSRLMSVPGVGVITALCFLSTIDEVKRFPNAPRLQSYLGLTPGEHSSSERQHRTSITKAGASTLRWLLVESAWTVYRHRRNEPIVQWAKEIEKRRGKRIAIVALARKLAGILYAVWRDETSYLPERAAEKASA